MSTIFQICILSLILASFSSVAGSRLTRAVMMSVAPSVNYNCSDLTITEKNSSSHVIVTGTVSTCGLPQAGSYRCTLQVQYKVGKCFCVFLSWLRFLMRDQTIVKQTKFTII